MLLKYWPQKTTLTFMNKRYVAFIASAILIVASIFLVSTRGLNFGIDFIGGSVVEIAEPDNLAVDEIRALVNGLGLGEVAVNTARATGVEARTVVVLRVKAQPAGEEGAEKAQQAATDLIENTLRAEVPNLDVRARSSVGPKVSGELLTAGLTALIAALVLMMIYIMWRFQWQYSVGAVAALAHDVMLTIGMFSALQLEFNLTTIAALLTIIGYSMNDTVVVFDRVREELRKYKKMPLENVIDLALNGTLSRTLITSGTTLLALLAIFFLGGPVLRGMSFALIWGVIIGTYSSVFVASSIVRTTGVRREKRAADDVQGFQGV